MKLKIIIISLCTLVFIDTDAAGFYIKHRDTDTYQEPYRGKKTKVQKKESPVNSVPVVEKPTKKTVAPKKEKSVATNRYIGIKTNIAYQAIAVQNLAAEVQINNRLTIELPLMWSFWDMERKHSIRTFALQPEVRWWLNSPGSGHFFGVHIHAAWFNVKWKDDRYQSTGRPLLGAGLSYGYTLPFHANWSAEFTLGAGYANMKYNTYYNIDNGALIDTRSMGYWGITRVGLSLVYHF